MYNWPVTSWRTADDTVTTTKETKKIAITKYALMFEVNLNIQNDTAVQAYLYGLRSRTQSLPARTNRCNKQETIHLSILSTYIAVRQRQHSEWFLWTRKWKTLRVTPRCLQDAREEKINIGSRGNTRLNFIGIELRVINSSVTYAILNRISSY